MATHPIAGTKSGHDGPHPVDVLVGERLRETRIRRGVSQSRLAEAIGVSFQQVQKYETGANRISASKIYTAAAALGVELATLFPPPGASAPNVPDLGRRAETAFTLEVNDLAHQMPAERRRLAS